MTFGGNLRAARKKAGLSQRDLAHRIGVHGLVISRYERGKHQPNLETATALARALGCKLDDLVPKAAA